MASGACRSPEEGVWLAWLQRCVVSWSVKLGWGSQSSEAEAAEQEFLVLVPPARRVPPEMGFLGVLPILILFILLGGVQEPGLVEAFFLSKYESKYQSKNWRLSLPKWRNGAWLGGRNKNFCWWDMCSPPLSGILGEKELYPETSF